MELDATTFILEVINFLVLVWLLGRFLYRPVQSALKARAAADQAQMQAVAAERAKLEADRAELQRQQADLAAQRSQAMAALDADISAQRQARLQALEDELQEERNKARARLEQERARACEHNEQALRQRMSAFLGSYLQRMASPAMEAAIIDLFLADLAQQSDAAQQVLRNGWTPEQPPPPFDISTAFPPSEVQQRQVEAQLSKLLGLTPQMRWNIYPPLIAGICVHLPGYQLEASLHRGMDAFAQTTAPLDNAA